MVMIDVKFDRFVKEVLKALSLYMDDVLFIGGCTNAIYRHIVKSQDYFPPPLFTKDFDAAVKGVILQGDRPTISQLLDNAGLVTDMQRTYEPPIMKFHPKDNPNFELEFLCPLTGGETDRHGKPKVTLNVQKGITAQQLRYLDILFIKPIEIDLTKIEGFYESGMPNKIKICNPGSYVIQKVLIRNNGRTPAKKDKDAYYIYEISILFSDELDALGKMINEVLEEIHHSWAEKFTKEIHDMFVSKASVEAIAAAKIFNEFNQGSAMRLDPEQVYLSVSRMIDAFSKKEYN